MRLLKIKPVPRHRQSKRRRNSILNLLHASARLRVQEAKREVGRDRPPQARILVGEIIEVGFGTADLKDAKALLDELSV